MNKDYLTELEDILELDRTDDSFLTTEKIKEVVDLVSLGLWAKNSGINTLEKIADPRKRDHKEPDAYTQLGCVMNMASEALEELKK